MLNISDNLICKISANTLIVRTRDGGDFLHGDDWIAEWKLYFNVRNGIFIDTTPLTGHEKPLQVDNVRIEDIPKYFYTKVNITFVLAIHWPSNHGNFYDISREKVVKN